jgi:hypothetical protein
MNGSIDRGRGTVIKLSPGSHKRAAAERAQMR